MNKNQAVNDQVRRTRSNQLIEQVGTMWQGSRSWYQTLEAAIAADPSNAIAYREMSVFYTKTGDYLNARKWLDKAVELSPFEQGYRGWLNLYKLRDYEGAVQDLNDFQQHTKSNHAWGEPVLFLLGLAKKGQRNYQEAITNFTSYIDQETASRGEKWVDVYAFVYRGICYYQLKAYEQALADFDKAIGYYENCTEAHFQKGKTYIAMGNNAAACQSLQAAKQLAKRGYIKKDIYKELFDQVYPEEIDELLATCNCN